MNLLAWNCRGLENPRSVRVFPEYAQRWDPKIMFLSETKLKKRSMEKAKEKAGYRNGLIIPSMGRSGGLLLLWKKDFWLRFRATQIITSIRLSLIHPRGSNGVSLVFMGTLNLTEEGGTSLWDI